jgi:hydroxymethylglutaryl-CoA reductase
MKALATTGIQKGNMSLHSHNIAMMAVARGDEVEQLAAIQVAKGTVRMDVAEKELLVIRAK